MLWQAVEKLRSENEAKRQLLETQRRNSVLSKALDVQVKRRK